MTTDDKRAYLEGLLTVDRAVDRLYAAATQPPVPSAGEGELCDTLAGIVALASDDRPDTVQARLGQIRERATRALGARPPIDHAGLSTVGQLSHR